MKRLFIAVYNNFNLGIDSDFVIANTKFLVIHFKNRIGENKIDNKKQNWYSKKMVNCRYLWTDKVHKCEEELFAEDNFCIFANKKLYECFR